MRLHTDGNSVTLLSPTGRLLWRPKRKPVVEPIASSLGITDFDRSGLLCLTPSGERDFSARLAARGAVAGAALDEDRVAAVVMDGAKAYLVEGPVDLDGDWEKVTELDGSGVVRVPWPANLIWKKGDKSMYEMAEANGPGIPDTYVPTLECNGFGVAVASPGSGTVIVKRPDGERFAVQVPSQEEAILYACPTQEGVLVTIVVDGQDSAYVHLAQDGTILGYRAAEQAAPGVLLDAGILLYDGATGRLSLCDSRLTSVTEIDAPTPVVEATGSHSGQSFALADDEHISLGHVDAKGQLQITDTFSYGKHGDGKRPGEIAAAEARWDPERTHGKAAVGFPAGVSIDPWTAAVDEDFELTMQARSVGGAGVGIRVEIGGDAMKNATLSAIEVDGRRVPLEKTPKGTYEADLPDIELVLGLQYPLEPKPKNDPQKHAAALFLAETHIELKVFGCAHKKSSDLMSVTISARQSDSPPLKWMRPLTIS